MTVILTVCGVLPVCPVQIHEHRESVRKERKTWQFERDALQEELGRLRGVVASKVKLNPQNPKDSLETSMQKVRWRGGLGVHGAIVMCYVHDYTVFRLLRTHSCSALWWCLWRR